MTQLSIEQHILQSLSHKLEKFSGQTLMSQRQYRVEVALGPVMRANSIPDMRTLAQLLNSEADPDLSRQSMEALINNETCFFRDQPHFALLTGPVMDMFHDARNRSRTIRIWSAACSTGQEAYSIAISMLENWQKWAGWKIEIWGSDISRSAVAKAKAGSFSQFEIQRGLPVRQMIKYFRREDENWVARDNLRQMVRFSEHNLFDTRVIAGKFDIILCRNMLIYLEEDRRQQLFDRLASALMPDGLLMLGAAETVIGQTSKLQVNPDFRGFYELSSRKLRAG